MWDSLFKAGRDALLLSEKLNSVQALAQKAMDLSENNNSRLIRLETIVELAVFAEQRRLPPQ